MPKDCCPRIVITQNRLILAFSVNATFKLKIEFSFSSRNHTCSLIYNFLQAAAKNDYLKWIFLSSKKLSGYNVGFKKTDKIKIKQILKNMPK